MCGIIGYVGEKEAVPILIKGLETLEYRGYDSAGVCVSVSEELNVIKKKGKIAELKQLPELSQINGNVGIAHTRWATHGEPNEINAHPHTDSKKEIAIVHNGIIENYYTLKKLLEDEGYNIVSETDSEIIAHLISKFYSGNLEEATMKALHFVEGAFGLVIMHSRERKIVAARKGSPLVIGIGNGEMFVASDITALMEHTKRVIYLNDDEIATLTPNNYSIKTLDGKEIDKNIDEIKWTVDQMEKGGFKHFMLKEIFEQPESIRNILRGRVKDNSVNLTLDFDFKEIEKIVLVACGTSWHSALIGKHFIEKLVRIPVEVDYASEFRYRDPLLDEKSLVVAISQSGETADTLAAIKEAKKKKAKTIGIVNVVGSSITREVSSGIYLHAGPEIGVASTKAFTSQVVALLLLSLYLRKEKNLSIDKEILDGLESLPEMIEKVLDSSEEIKKIAEKLKDKKNFLYLGRGLNFPTALEGALKLKEISYIHAEGYPAAEMKHGPIALIDDDMPVVFVCPKDDTYKKIMSNMEEVKARKGNIVAVINEKDDKISELAEHVIEVPKTSELLSPIVNSIPLQLFAYYIADFKGCDIDKPRNLAKSVTVE
ncbi:MAG: glutamine--fructose-6-phosphate transaminase (isomerizing) [Nanoarchaeota archaeon]|nr:glutamine--fructose-6-phosphate transaminase (isomerizing) [Nanoarchaeota archaeon]